MNFRKIITTLLCTFLMTGCGKDVASQSEVEKISAHIFRIGAMTQDEDLNNCTLNGWCRITDENYTYRTTYSGKITDMDDISRFIADLDVSGYELGRHEMSEDHAVTIKSDKVGFLKISTGTSTVYGYDDLDNLTVGNEPALCIQTGNGEQNCVDVYLIPQSLKEDFERIIADSIANEDNITDVYKLPDYSYTDITDSHPKDLIVFVNGYSNYAWEPQNHGRFIDIHGYVYEYNMDGRSFMDVTRGRTGDDSMTSDQAFVDALYYEFYYKNSPVAMVDADTIFDCYTKMFAIDRDADFELKHEACDYGQHSLYMIDIDDQENMCLKLRTKGDNTGHLDDPYAEEIMEIYDSLEIREIN